jgi:hypothetical protein
LKRILMKNEGKSSRRLKMRTRVSKGKWTLITVALLTALFIAACGGGGGSAGGGIGGTGKSVGAISGFGSIFVNGVEFHTGSAAISIDDSAVAGTEGDLKLGMVVEIEGEFNDDGTTGTAFTVISDDVVEGPITVAVNTTEQSFTVMNREVFYSASTIFEDTGLLGGDRISATALSIDNVVEVSGLVDRAGQIKATRVERKSLTFTPGKILEVNGLVANLDTTAETFNIGLLAINYSAGGTSFDNGTIADLAEGVLVEVRGTNNVVGDGFLDADRIEFEFEDFGNNGDLLEFEGFVTDRTPLVGDFEVNGLPVVTSGQTQWRGGYTGLGDVVLDDRVEVEGTLQDQSGTQVLVAREVELELDEDVKVEAYVESVDLASQTLTMIGITFAYDGNTDFDDKSGGVDPFSASDINATVPTTDWLSIRGYIDSNGNIIATEVERDNDDDDPTRVILQGPVSDVPVSPPGDFTILGLTIAVDGIVGIQYEIEDVGTNSTNFFNNLTSGRVVKARGSYDGSGTLTPEELDLQN